MSRIESRNGLHTLEHAEEIGLGSRTYELVSIDAPTPDDEETSNSGNVLVAYFSRAGENYSVGVIDKGNTAIIAELIAEQTGIYYSYGAGKGWHFGRPRCKGKRGL